jgi:hypothetical protein
MAVIFSTHVLTACYLSMVAHELGHILGLIREHQRHDCDDYVRFACENLVSHCVTKHEVDPHPEWSINMSDVCRSNYLGSRPELHRWTILNYSKDRGTVFGRPYMQTSGKDYEHVSITQYLNNAGAHWDAYELDQLPLVRWKKTGYDAPPAGTIPTTGNAKLTTNAIQPRMGMRMVFGDFISGEHCVVWHASISGHERRFSISLRL